MKPLKFWAEKNLEKIPAAGGKFAEETFPKDNRVEFRVIMAQFRWLVGESFHIFLVLAGVAPLLETGFGKQ